MLKILIKNDRGETTEYPVDNEAEEAEAREAMRAAGLTQAVVYVDGDANGADYPAGVVLFA